MPWWYYGNEIGCRVWSWHAGNEMTCRELARFLFG